MSDARPEPPANPHSPWKEWGQALDRLDEALRMKASEAGFASILRDAAIQRFEFSLELTWKTLKRALEAEGLEAATPRQALQKAFAAGWIDEESLWLGMLRDRNLTSHTYREALAVEIHSRLPRYLEKLRALHGLLRSRTA